jgi:hypothetical protein
MLELIVATIFVLLISFNDNAPGGVEYVLEHWLMMILKH